MKISEADRLAAREEREHSKRKMSAQSVARMRHMAEERERSAEAEARFVVWFERLDKDLATLTQFLSGLDCTKVCGKTRMDLDSEHIKRRAVKVQWCLLSKNWKPTCVSDVRLFAELTPGELAMSDAEFFEIMPPITVWDEQKAMPKPEAEPVPFHPMLRHLADLGVDCYGLEDEHVPKIAADWGIAASPIESAQRCANDRCTKGPNGTRALVTEGRYCSNACRSSMGRRLPPKSTKPRRRAGQPPLEDGQNASQSLHLA